MDLEPDVRLRRLVATLARGPGVLDAKVREKATRLEGVPGPLGDFVTKLARSEVTGDDIALLRDTGYSQDEVVELAVCVALGVATACLRTGLVALEEAEPW